MESIVDITLRGLGINPEEVSRARKETREKYPARAFEETTDLSEILPGFYGIKNITIGKTKIISLSGLDISKAVDGLNPHELKDLGYDGVLTTLGGKTGIQLFEENGNRNLYREEVEKYLSEVKLWAPVVKKSFVRL